MTTAQMKQPVNVNISLHMEPGEVAAGDQDGQGTMTLYVRSRIDLTGDILEITGTLLEGLTQENIAGAITGALVDILGEEVTEGGVYVHG